MEPGADIPQELIVDGNVYTQTTLEQTHFQIYNDANGLNNAPPLAGVDQSVQVALGQKFRCRLQIYNELGSATRFLLEYRVNGGVWRAVDSTEARSDCG